MRAVGARHFYANTGSADVRGRMGMFCQRRAYLEMPRPYVACEHALLLSSDNATALVCQGYWQLGWFSIQIVSAAERLAAIASSLAMSNETST
jgi:hypothetical protein